MAIVAQMERKEKSKRLLRNAAIGLAILIVVAGAAYGISKLPSPRRTVHWHAKYEVYVNSQHLNFDNPALNGQSLNYNHALYLPAHLHSPSDVIHNEGLEGEGTMAKFFDYDLGGKLTSTEMVVPPVVLGANGDFKTDANHTLQMFLDQTPFADQINKTAPKSNWHQVNDFPNYSFHDGDRILLLYGNYTQDQIAQLEAQYATFDPKTIT